MLTELRERMEQLENSGAAHAGEADCVATQASPAEQAATEAALKAACANTEQVRPGLPRPVGASAAPLAKRSDQACSTAPHLCIEAVHHEF